MPDRHETTRRWNIWKLSWKHNTGHTIVIGWRTFTIPGSKQWNMPKLKKNGTQRQRLPLTQNRDQTKDLCGRLPRFEESFRFVPRRRGTHEWPCKHVGLHPQELFQVQGHEKVHQENCCGIPCKFSQKPGLHTSRHQKTQEGRPDGNHHDSVTTPAPVTEESFSTKDKTTLNSKEIAHTTWRNPMGTLAAFGTAGKQPFPSTVQADFWSANSDTCSPPQKQADTNRRCKHRREPSVSLAGTSKSPTTAK